MAAYFQISRLSPTEYKIELEYEYPEILSLHTSIIYEILDSIEYPSAIFLESDTAIRGSLEGGSIIVYYKDSANVVELLLPREVLSFMAALSDAENSVVVQYDSENCLSDIREEIAAFGGYKKISAKCGIVLDVITKKLADDGGIISIDL